MSEQHTLHKLKNSVVTLRFLSQLGHYSARSYLQDYLKYLELQISGTGKSFIPGLFLD